MLEILASADDEPMTDHREDMRGVHARRYLLVARPVAMVLGVVVTLVSVLSDRAPNELTDFSVLALALLLTIGGAAAALRWDPLRVAMWSIPMDATVMVGAILESAHPEQTTLLLLWPVIGTAFFGTARAALMLTVGCAGACVWFAQALDGWHDRSLLPSVAIGILFCGLLVTFALHQSRQAELRLARDRDRDRRALQLSRRIHFAVTPADALVEIAREVGVELDADAVAVGLLDLEELQSTDGTAWHASDDSHRDTRFDEVLCMLVAGGHGVIAGGAGVRAIGRGCTPATHVDVDAGTIERAVRAQLRELGHEHGILVPLALGNITIGVMLLARTDDGWQERTCDDLEPIVPQLAAGLAQAVLVRDQHETLEQLERVDRMRDRLIANVSHELRTPLTSTIGFIETLLRDDLQMDRQTRGELMEHAREGGRRLLALVEDLLALGSTRPESLDLSPEPIPACELVEVALRCIEVPSSRELALDVCTEAHVVVDRNRVLQVLSNLVTNAVRHGAGTIEVRVRSEGPHTTIDVLDDGPGVLPEHVHELFLPFARFSTRTDSTGLGLAICRTIVEAHGGSIRYSRVESGRRTRFRVRLPAA